MIRVRILILFIGLASNSFATSQIKQDTISHWNVLIGEKIIAQLNDFISDSVLVINKSDARVNILIVQYFSDTPCHKCLVQLSIKSNNGDVITTIDSSKNRTEFSIKLDDEIIKLIQKYSIVFVYYHEELLFKLRIE